MTPETLVKKKLKQWFVDVALTAGKGFWTAWSDRYKSGMPDFIAIDAGHTMFYEAKAEKGKFSMIQALIAKQLMHAGADYYIVTYENKALKFWNLKDAENWKKWAPPTV